MRITVLNEKSKRDRINASNAVEIVRQRYERYARRQFTRILNRTYRDFIELDRIPTAEDIAEIINRNNVLQQNAIAKIVNGIYPEASMLAVPDDQIRKSADGMEYKAREDEERELLERWVRENTGTLIRDMTAEDMAEDLWYINQTTVDEIRKAILQANYDAKVFKELVQQIMQETPARAYRIARTETARASNVSMNIASEVYSFGRKMTKTWITVGGPAVRSSHRQMDGVTIPREQSFLVPNRYGGFDMMDYPLDSSHGASAGNVVNCRCRCSYSYVD